MFQKVGDKGQVQGSKGSGGRIGVEVRAQRNRKKDQEVPRDESVDSGTEKGDGLLKETGRRGRTESLKSI